ncbi:hypothetical protein LCR01_07290 [Companilactobacillus crustorum]|uniref:Uncharacterized protein n=2 Tax=Companilactobacillus TaxID=2767879 RepID=A0A2P4R458_9LACO|nr:hypothetical protein LCR01_07290 [Companilactobacillus crustorum]HCD07561.1 hypothetical protein [Lactobacillus sp.]
MKDKVPRVTLRVSILLLILTTIILYFFNRPNAILAIFAVIVLSIIYLGGMERNHEVFMRHRRRKDSL